MGLRRKEGQDNIAFQGDDGGALKESTDYSTKSNKNPNMSRRLKSDSQ